MNQKPKKKQKALSPFVIFTDHTDAGLLFKQAALFLPFIVFIVYKINTMAGLVIGGAGVFLLYYLYIVGMKEVEFFKQQQAARRNERIEQKRQAQQQGTHDQPVQQQNNPPAQEGNVPPANPQQEPSGQPVRERPPQAGPDSRPPPPRFPEKD